MLPFLYPTPFQAVHAVLTVRIIFQSLVTFKKRSVFLEERKKRSRCFLNMWQLPVFLVTNKPLGVGQFFNRRATALQPLMHFPDKAGQYA